MLYRAAANKGALGVYNTVAALAPKPVSDVLVTEIDINIQVPVNVISGGLTPSFTSNEAEEMGGKIISTSPSRIDVFSMADHH